MSSASFPVRPAKYKRAPNDPPEYPGAVARAKELREQFPFLSHSQAWVMAAVEISPGRNDGAVFIGWDVKLRPIFKRTEFGSVRYNATTKSGDPTTPTAPFNLTPEARQEGFVPA